MKKLARRVERRRLLSAMLALAFCLSTMFGLLVTSSSDGTDTAVREGPTGDDVTPVRALALTAHDPILIDGNAGFTNASGVVWGSGTESDPYIIADWDIDASTTVGLLIQGTDAHFIVRNCYVHESNPYPYAGSITLLNCVNGTLENNTCSNNGWGMWLESSSNITVSNNNCSNNDMEGIWLDDLGNSTLSNNTCSSNYVGIFLHASSNNNMLTNNTCSNNWKGIHLESSHDNTVSNNTCSFNDGSGIDVTSATFPPDPSGNNRLVGNTCSSNNGNGIELSFSDNNDLDNNTCSSNTLAGIWTAMASSINIINNTCSNNDVGLSIGSGWPNMIQMNWVEGNTEWGIWVCCFESGIWNNTLIGNNGATETYDAAHIQAYDGTSNWWNSTDGYGNYWSDWNSPDNDTDGIVDAPYEIAGSAGVKDWYPLTRCPDITEEPPVADAGLDQTVDEDTVVTLNGSVSHDDIGVMNWTWTFTDGVLRTLYGEVVEWPFTHPGVYTVTLVVRDTIGQKSAPDTCVITVRDVTPPVANAGVDVTLFMSVGTQITFNGSASSDNVDVASYTWTFVDVTSRTLTGVTPTYTFTGPGEYTVTLTIADAADSSATDTVVVTVLDDVDPVADAGLDQNILAGATVTFDGSGSSDNVGILNYTWSFTDGTGKTLYEVGQTYTFETSGTYPVTLKVSDAVGNYATDTVIITVLEANEPPVADAGANQTVTVGDVVTFIGLSSSDDTHIENYTWAFTYDDEARELYGASPKFTFDIAGIYVVTLTVEDVEGETSTDTVTITVEEQEDEKSFIESYGLALGIAVALVITSLVLFFIMKGRKGGMAPTSMEEAPTSEPEIHGEGHRS